MRRAQKQKNKNEGIWFKHDGNQIIRFLINHMFTATFHLLQNQYSAAYSTSKFFFIPSHVLGGLPPAVLTR